MRKKKVGVFSFRVFLIVFMMSVGVNTYAVSEKALIKNLSPTYKRWIDLVTYIIAKEERRAFLDCTNDRDREVLISMFWKMRDPTPGTKENEFKNEHIKRFNYANKYFKYGAGRPGWMTDRGKIHIILGKPASIDKYEMDSVVHDCQLWSYYGDKKLRLPGQFYVFFYKRNGIGEYKIYDPVADGTYALLIKTTNVVGRMGTASYRRAYKYLKKTHPVLAMASLSLVPDETPMDYRPTFRSQVLIKNVLTAPLRRVNTRYATDFGNFKGIVKVDTTIRYIGSKNRVDIIKDRSTGLNFVHFAILPDKVSADYSEVKDKYYFHYKMKVVLRQGKNNVFKYEKNFPVYIKDESELRAKFSNSVILSDSFPVPSGKYKLKVVVNNSVNGELIYFEKDITVKDEKLETPTVSSPIITKTARDLHRLILFPYKLGNIEAVVNPYFTFGKKDTLYIIGSIDLGDYKNKIKISASVKGLFNNKYNKTYDIIPQKGRITYFKQFINTVPSGNYRVLLSVLSEKGVVLDKKASSFSVNLREYSKTPASIHKFTKFDNLFNMYRIISYQYKNIGKFNKALRYILKAYDLNNNSPNVFYDYADLLLAKNDFKTVLSIVERFKNTKDAKFIYNSIKGRALYLKGNYNEAIDVLEVANELYDSDLKVLNTLGMAYLKMGVNKQAKKVLKASLKINSEQGKIKKILKDI